VTGCTSRGDTSCDDGDACTDDACDPAAGCASVRRRGASGLRCLLDALEAYVAGIPADGLGTKTRKRVGRTLAAMRAKLAPLGTPVPRKADRAARSIGKLRAKAEKTVRRARDVRPEVAAALLDMLTGRMPSLR
jgi:hypothetical protein